MAALEFSPLERAALEAFVDTYEGEYPGLAAQLAIVRPIKRENTGGGFFTDLQVDRHAVAPLTGASPINHFVVDVDGMRYPIGLLMFHEEGYVRLLEGYAVGGDDTLPIDFTTVRFGPVRLHL